MLWLFFGVVLTWLALYQIRVPKLMRRLAARVGQLLDARDHLRIIGGGVVLPYLAVMMVNGLTPFGGRDWSIAGNHFLMPMAHYVCLMVLMTMLPVMILRRRLAVKAGVLGFTAERAFWPGIAVVLAVVLVPGIGWFASSDSYWGCAPASAFLVVLALVLLCAGVSRALFTARETRLLRCAVASRALVPAYASVMLLMAIAATAHKGAERTWFRRDTTMTSVPGFPGVGPYEYRVAEKMRKEIREIPPLE